MSDNQNNEDDNDNETELSPEQFEAIMEEQREHMEHVAYQAAYLFQSVTNNYNNLKSSDSSYPAELYLNIMETISDAQNEILNDDEFCGCDDCMSNNNNIIVKETCDDCKQKIDKTLKKLDWKNNPDDEIKPDSKDV